MLKVMAMKDDITIPELSGAEVSELIYYPRRRVISAGTADESPSIRLRSRKVVYPPMPTPARAVSPRRPTIAASTRLRRLCDNMPPIIGRPRVRMVLMRCRRFKNPESLLPMWAEECPAEGCVRCRKGVKRAV